MSCETIVDADIPECMIRMMAAVWNFPDVVDARDPLGQYNYLNAYNNSLFTGVNIYPLLDQLIW